MRRVLVTGATGFIGAHLLRSLAEQPDLEVTAAHRGLAGEVLAAGQGLVGGDLVAMLDGYQSIIHLAGIAHRWAAPSELQRVNLDWPVGLYGAAREAGVRGFVFLSTVKVLGEVSGRPFVESDPYAPGDAYARSKASAKQALMGLAEKASMPALAILRVPLVYGPGVKANFLQLLAWAERARRGWPLPLGAARAPRSFLGVRNLCDLIRRLPDREGIFHGSDGEDLDVSSLLRHLGARGLVPVPAPVVRAGLVLAGRRGAYDRLFRPLQVDAGRTRSRLGWTPPLGVLEQLRETQAWYRCSR